MPFARSLGAIRARSFAQVATYPPGSAFGPRELADYELVWILDGECTWSTDQDSDDDQARTMRSRTLRPGSLVLARCGAVDSYQWTAERRSRHAFVHFSLSEEELESEPAWPSIRPLHADPVLSELCAYLLQLAALGSDSARERSDQILAVLVDIFVRGPLASDQDAAFENRLVEFLEQVRASWEETGMHIIGNAELAAWSNLSTGHLSRLFRQRFGQGPASVLETARLVRAAITLQRTDMALHLVAASVGFVNEYHFSRRFARLYSTPPGRYRRLQGDHDPLEPVREAALRGAINLLLAGGS